MRRYAILVKRAVEPYGVGPFETRDEAQAYIKRWLQECRVEIVSFYEPVKVETAR